MEENMASLYSVNFLKIVKEFNLEEVWAPDDVDTVRIETNELNRPGLPFTVAEFIRAFGKRYL